MCLIAWSWQPDSATPLLLLANRDEFYARPALPLHGWPHTPVLAGRDLEHGGTWLGVSRSGRLAALTNYRAPALQRADAPSRGHLVLDFLQSDATAQAYVRQVAAQALRYNPFNLLVYDGSHLLGLESRQQRVLAMSPGIGAVSNADFETPWPKLVHLRQRLQAQLGTGQTEHADLLPLLHDRTPAPDSALPDTGIGLELERWLSAIFMATPTYGTRACSVVSLHRSHIAFTEQSFDARGETGTVREVVALQPGGGGGVWSAAEPSS